MKKSDIFVGVFVLFILLTIAVEGLFGAWRYVVVDPTNNRRGHMGITTVDTSDIISNYGITATKYFTDNVLDSIVFEVDITEIATLDAVQEIVEDSLAEHKTAIDSINENVSDNVTAIGTNATDITNLETAVDTMNPNISDNAAAIDALPTFAETGGLVSDSVDVFIIGGSTTFNSMTGRQITHSLGVVDHFTFITQTDSSGYVGEIHVRKGTTVDTVFNSGAENSSAFMWIVLPNR